MKKRIAALVLCLALVFALAACGGESGEKLSFGTPSAAPWPAMSPRRPTLPSPR